MSTWNDENRWYARLMKLAHELAMEGRDAALSRRVPLERRVGGKNVKRSDDG